MNDVFAVDTSVAVPLLLRTHPDHAAVLAWADGKQLSLAGHAAVETYSVLTRLPAGARASNGDVVRVMDDSFAEVIVLPTQLTRTVHRHIATFGISGGAVYDALVGLAAKENGLTLATRDTRALGTYQAIGVPVLVLGFG
ncbi:MAG: type II toxin-antitoxin system VapC family toxin [Propionibacteriaceae bacterium]|nr:type II toxin-antitoxin system VapC family toxin [Propionibacteriaceae bacterium]